MNSYPHRKHSDVMRAYLSLSGMRVADVGCGDGALVRFMTREGATVVGIECSPAQLARAHAAEPAAGERYIEGVGKDLPLEDATLDLVVFFNSLHHVPVEAQEVALAEAARVLKPDGLLYVMEPLAEGTYFELMRPVDDETQVRARAYDALRAAAAGEAFEEIVEERYAAPFKHKSFADCVADSLAVDPERRAAFEAAGEALAQGFEAAAEKRDGAYWFDQPSRLNLLRRTAVA
ncbi:MAG: class I SAM-dependent methyltransferase [Kiloniellales bacterium]